MSDEYHTQDKSPRSGGGGRLPKPEATASLGGHLAGFVLTFTHGGEMYARQAGFDYEAQGKLPLYFGLVYYELLRIALSEGISQIHYSTGSDRVKLSRGCTPRRQIAYVKARRAEQMEQLSRLAHRCALE
ncbi:GNAT family N-acetyltransferase [Streptomyces sp. NPDC001832]|uniref:GNAT family N-acetyltransferase n=1 Tax=Streptomyces sp. NPDC001832 TaxID=3154527 RepID=UPI00331B0EDD